MEKCTRCIVCADIEEDMTCDKDKYNDITLYDFVDKLESIIKNKDNLNLKSTHIERNNSVEATLLPEYCTTSIINLCVIANFDICDTGKLECHETHIKIKFANGCYYIEHDVDSECPTQSLSCEYTDGSIRYTDENFNIILKEFIYNSLIKIMKTSVSESHEKIYDIISKCFDPDEHADVIWNLNLDID